MDDVTAKVGDFGLSKQRDMDKYSVYIKKTRVVLSLNGFFFCSFLDSSFDYNIPAQSTVPTPRKMDGD